MRKYLPSIFSFILLAIIAAPFFVSAASPYAGQGIVPCGGPGEDACNICHLFIGIQRIINFLLEGIAFPAAVIVLLYGGGMWVIGGDSPDKVKKGQEAMRLAVVGMIWAFAAWLIIDTMIKGLAVGTGGVIEGWGPWNAIPSCM